MRKLAIFVRDCLVLTITNGKARVPRREGEIVVVDVRRGRSIKGNEEMR